MRATQLGSGWKRLWRHSYRLGVRWLLRDAGRRWPAGRTGFVRLLVPLDPWRYYEMGRVADQTFSGHCLDVSSPKLLPSLLQREGKGDWLGIDLFSKEIENWKRIDPKLDLEVQDACNMPYAANTFDAIVCLSVLEHIGSGKDAAALAEMWRVLKPGGVLHLTTDVASEARDVFVDGKIYGEASTSSTAQGVFFKHDYSVEEIEKLARENSWHKRDREFAVQRNPRIEELLYKYAPWSFVFGPFLRFVCPNNFTISETPDLIRRPGSGVVYLQLEKTVDRTP
jgi:SAM-dependent methyltransferase